IYMGNKMVIHFTRGSTILPKGAEEFSELGPCEKCQGFNGGPGRILIPGKVVKCCLRCFGDKMHLYAYGVSWKEALAIPGTCCPYKSKSLEEAVKTANEKLNTGFDFYTILYNNCEVFATFCRTGKIYSIQPVFDKFGNKVLELPVELEKIAARNNENLEWM
ncbi:LRAT domain-containing protein, partial [Cephalotus follicularis]